ncbi:MAG: hypothetical protein RXR17_02745 [Sulfolobaceae archaeon]
MSKQFKKILFNNKDLVLVGNLFYADTDLIVNNTEKLKVTNSINNVIYVELNIENDSYRIVKGVLCKSRIHTYLCNIVAEMKKEITDDEEIKQIYLKMLEEVAKVIT